MPHLYVGLEYGSTGNHEQAEHFLTYANTIEPDSPLILQELGTNAFHLKKYNQALQYFFEAIKIIQKNEQPSSNSNSEISRKWEPLLHNIGSAYRKLGKFADAVSFNNDYTRLPVFLAALFPSNSVKKQADLQNRHF